MSDQAKSSSKSTKTRNDIDSILDAALDEIDLGDDSSTDDDDDDNDDERVAVQQDTANHDGIPRHTATTTTSTKNSAKPTVTPPARKNDTEVNGKKQKSSGNNKNDAMAASFEDMMNQFLQPSEGEGDGNIFDGLEDNPEMDQMMAELMSQMQSTLTEAAPVVAAPKEPKTKKLPKKNTTPVKEPPQEGPSDTHTTEGNVDRTVAKLLTDMSKLGASSSEEEASGTESGQMEQMGEEMMQEMLKEFETMGQKGDSDDIVNGMMKQLLSKELMYEPMKQVTDRFPRWLAENKPFLAEEEYTRYGKQYQYFQRIVAVYETDADNFDRLTELMQDIQEFGQPPADIIKELAPELEFDKDGMPKMDMGGMGLPMEQCAVM